MATKMMKNFALLNRSDVKLIQDLKGQPFSAACINELFSHETTSMPKQTKRVIRYGRIATQIWLF